MFMYSQKPFSTFSVTSFPTDFQIISDRLSIKSTANWRGSTSTSETISVTRITHSWHYVNMTQKSTKISMFSKSYLHSQYSVSWTHQWSNCKHRNVRSIG